VRRPFFFVRAIGQQKTGPLSRPVDPFPPLGKFSAEYRRNRRKKQLKNLTHTACRTP
jgi:hypothetical protein